MLFVDALTMADLNKRFLGQDGPTDVLAFPIDEEPVEGGRSPDSGGTGPGDTSEPTDMPTVLGDVVVCPAVAHRNAPEHAGTYEDEVALLIVHGLLHLLGMDHEDDEEAEAMEEREQELLAKFHRPAVDPPAAAVDPPVAVAVDALTAGAVAVVVAVPDGRTAEAEPKPRAEPDPGAERLPPAPVAEAAPAPAVPTES
jgi:probable rRNA maturation factor